MKIGVVSDTHGQLSYAKQAVAALSQHPIDAVLHCGDVGGREIIELFARWPLHFVLGNVDTEADYRDLDDPQGGIRYHERFGQIQLEGVDIALIHSDDRGQFEDAVDSGRFDLVCYGHTHRAECRRVGRTVVLNPGALYRANRHSLAIVDLPACEAEHLWL